MLCLCLCDNNELLDFSCLDYSSCRKSQDNCDAPSKRKKSLGLEHKGKEHRTFDFYKENHPEVCFQFLTEAEFDAMKEGYKLINTEKSTKLAPKNFTAWKEACVKANLDACPDDTLLSSEPSILCQWFSEYAAETKTTAGKSYHPSIHLLFTSYLLVCCGTRVM